MFKIFLFVLVLLNGCSNPFGTDEVVDACSDCKLDVYCELPQDENGVYLLQWNDGLIQTYTTVFAETDCGWSRRIQWDTNYQYRIGVDWVSLINPASMTDDEGNGRIIFGVWEDFVGYTITCYGGYMDECDNHHVDSLRIKIIR